MLKKKETELHGFAASAYRDAVKVIDKMRADGDIAGLAAWRRHVHDHRYTGRQRVISDMLIAYLESPGGEGESL